MNGDDTKSMSALAAASLHYVTGNPALIHRKVCAI